MYLKFLLDQGKIFACEKLLRSWKNPFVEKISLVEIKLDCGKIFLDCGKLP